MHKLFSKLVNAAEDLWFLMLYGRLGGFDATERRQVRTTIKALKRLQKQGVYVYGATNRVRVKGSPLFIVLTGGGVTAGSPAIAASAVAGAGFTGFVESAKDANNAAVLHTEGVWTSTFTVVTSIAIGDPIYITTAGVLTQTAAANFLFAKSLVALGAGSASVTMKLIGN
jgi:hypothetical protein